MNANNITMINDSILIGSRGLPLRIRAAFTIVELLVVVAIIILLLSILIVAMNAGARTAQVTRTTALMNSISKGLVRFKEDVGYYPPLLGVAATPTNLTATPSNPELRRLFPNSVPHPTATYSGGTVTDHMQEYFSTCTVADYLVGYGSHRDDGYGRVPGLTGALAWENESPPVGIRHPGDDGAWGSLILGGGVDQRNKWQTGNSPTSAASYTYGSSTSPYPIDQGKVLGPYLELKDERLLAGIFYGPSGLQTFFQGDDLTATGFTWDTIPKAIVDYWGQPIRYYRRPYPPGALGQSWRAVGTQYVPTLGDVIALRPWDLPPRGDVSGIADALGDTGTTQQLMNAEFGLLSTGPDKQWNHRVRRDDQPAGPYNNTYNKDNIIEVGP